MNIRAVGGEFQQSLAGGPESLAALPPVAGLEAFVQFYRARRADHCLPDDDGDVLIFQWGIYDWGAGERFEVSLTRDLLTAAGDGEEDVWQVALAYRFPPGKELRALGEGELWCDDPADADTFWRGVRELAPFRAVADRADGEVELGEGEA